MAGPCLPAPRRYHLDGTPTPRPERAPAAARAPTSPATHHGTLPRTKKLCSNPNSCEVAHPFACLLSVSPGPAPPASGSLRPAGPSTPSVCPGPGERSRGKEEGTVKAGHPPPPGSPSRSGLATSLVPTLWAGAPAWAGSDRRERRGTQSQPRETASAARQPTGPSPPDWTHAPHPAVWDYQEKTKAM